MKKLYIFLFFFTFTCYYSIQAQTRSLADSLDAIHYDIHIDTIDFAGHSIAGSTTVLLTPLNSPVPSINLDLVQLTVTDVWLNDDPVTDYTQNDSLVTIPLVFPLMPGDTVSVKINYNGVPFHEDWGGFHFSGEYAFNLGVGFVSIPHNLGKTWFPCIDNFTDRATYDVYCTMPEGKMAVGGGLLEEEIDNGNGTTTYHWHLAQTIPTYLASLAAGNYIDFPDTFEGMNGIVPIDIYVRPTDTSRVAGTFVHLKQILAIFEQCMGPYPWDRVGYTATAIGAMEHATNIFIPYSVISGNTANEAIVAHELSHMWMGDKVTCSSAQEMWINEGWATFFEMYYALALTGNQDAFKETLRSKHGGVLQYCHTPSGDGSYFPLNQIPQQYTYGMSAYDRGGTVAQALRFYLGDSLFFETLTAFLDTFAFQPVSSYDMRDFMTSYTGIDMNGFFDNFVLNSGTPHYSVDSFSVTPDRTRDLYDVTTYVKQKRHGPAFTGNGNIMEVMFMDDNWNRYTDTIHFDGATGFSVKTLPFAPSVILVDPEEKMCDATTDNYKKISSTGNYSFDKTFCSINVESISDSAFIQVTHNWAPPDSLRVPVAGLRLSDYRYWCIDGIIPEGFHASATFLYNVNGFLDNTLITSSSDTLIILYRKGAVEDWHEILFQKIGPWNVGNIIVPDMQAGEYTLAVKESTVGSFNLLPENKGSFEIFPNPSSGDFTIINRSQEPGEIRIFSDTGIVVCAFHVLPGKEKLTWKTDGLSAGSYMVAFYQESNPRPEVKRVVYLP